MVAILSSNPRVKSVDVTLSITEIFDILNGLFILAGNKENDITKYGGDAIDQQQLQRYQTLIADMQNVKGMIK